MPIRKILVALTGADSDGVTAETALTLGSLFGARVEGLFARPRPEDAIAFVGEGMSSAVVGEIVEAAAKETKDRADKAGSAFSAACRGHGYALGEAGGTGAAAWSEVEGMTDVVVAERGRLADLIVLGHPGGEEPDRTSVAVEGALFESGTPVFHAGPSAADEPSATIVVAWDGSARAAAAVRAALPFLERAESVIGLSIGDADEIVPPPAALVDYLALHDTAATATSMKDDGPAGQMIVEGAASEGATLLVMGAYGHSRLREMVLGGATRSVLDKAGLPVLMAH